MTNTKNVEVKQTRLKSSKKEDSKSKPDSRHAQAADS
jgi:hypothetical protein